MQREIDLELALAADCQRFTRRHAATAHRSILRD